ncbi:hypothetical protein FYK55_21855 [Roseiconus nitratireducens]|uniref:ANTAR domain-containing protein n=1 Tax=Roseiconus nitratireducens TaxID=2605748 RepID=A0A5M6CYH7_9BACT|nr:hypothetical protein [Roseiconus nitratireducens]KAA5540274.1 hypothetical protein FYK55_21855 [Roseiconus nitratireducens]
MRTDSGLNRRGELRMVERAINQGWKTPPEQADRALRLAFEVLADDDASEREVLSAVRVVMAAVRTTKD